MFYFLNSRNLVDVLHVLGLLGDGGGLTFTALAGEDVLAEAGELELGDEDVGGVDGDVDGLLLGVFAGGLVNVDAPLEAVALGDLTFDTLELAAEDLDFVFLADGHGADGVGGAEFLREAGAHEDTADVARSLEVSAAELSAGDGAVVLGVTNGHCCFLGFFCIFNFFVMKLFCYDNTCFFVVGIFPS